MTQYKDFSLFLKAFETQCPKFCLLLGKESKESVRKLLQNWQDAIERFVGSHFDCAKFSQEAETLPFLNTKRLIYVEGIDDLTQSESAFLLEYLKNPSPFTQLVLSALTLSSSTKLFKEIEKGGLILNLGDQKPWEREKILVQELVHEAQKQGVLLPATVAQKLIAMVGKEEALLHSELHKLLCLSYNEKEITFLHLEQISIESPQHTLWKLSDAILSCDFETTLHTAESLLDNDTSIFAILSHLKTQLKSQLEMFTLAVEGGAQAVAQSYPYLKGALLQKKIDQLKTYGLKRLRNGLIEVFKSELQAKNSAIDYSLVLTLLLVKLCPSPSYPTS